MDKYYGTVLLATIAYIIIWSIISVDRFYSLHAYVYDAGLFMQDWYDVIGAHWTVSSFFLSFTLRGLKFIFFPLILAKSFPLLFVFQTIFIAISACLIYLIAIKNGLRKDISCILALGYLLFFPLAGTNFFDIHNIAFFPTLFLFGYYFISNGNTKLSIIFFILASLVKYPLSILVTLFSLVVILEFIIGKRSSYYKKNEIYTYSITLLFSLSFFLVRYVYVLLIDKIILPHDALVSGFLGPHLTNIDLIITFLILIGPFLFLPLFSIKSLPFILGYFGLATMTRFLGYGFPYGITDQYVYLLVPFLFIGTIDTLSGKSIVLKILRTTKKLPGKKWTHKRKWRIRYRLNKIRVVVYTMLAIIILLALFFEPYGPFNGIFKGTAFDMQEDFNVNITNYNNVLKLVSTVPSSDPYIVIQNGLPEIFPRSFEMTGNPMATPGILEVPGVGHSLSYNLSYENSNHEWKKIRIDYVIADPYQSTYFESDPYPNNLSMYQLVKELYASGDYGIYSEIDGMVVLKHDYYGIPRYYQKFSSAFSGSTLISSHIVDGNVSTSDVSAGKDQWIPLWRTPQIPLSPGEYEINVSYMYENPTNNQSLYSLILSTSGSTEVNETTYNLLPDNLGPPGEIHILHLYTDISNFTNQFQVFAQIDPGHNWLGIFNVSMVTIQQIRPANTCH